MRINSCNLEFEESDMAVMPWLVKEVGHYMAKIRPYDFENTTSILRKLSDATTSKGKGRRGTTVISLSLNETKRLKVMLDGYMRNGVGPAPYAAHHLLARYIVTSLSLS